MSSIRAGQPGATRLCPHCKATVLESATICPGCRHHLRFNGGKQAAAEAYTALSVDGTIAHRQRGDPCEYCIVLDIANERGERVLRQVVGVGALQPGEQRRLHVSVEMLPLVPTHSQAAQPQAAQPQPTPLPKASVKGPTPAGIPAAATPPAAASAAAAAPKPAGTAALSTPNMGPAATRDAPRPSLSHGARPFATPAVAAPAVAPPAAAAPATAQPVVAPPAAATPAAAATAPSSTDPSPGGTLGQRLRIFRKP